MIDVRPNLGASFRHELPGIRLHSTKLIANTPYSRVYKARVTGSGERVIVKHSSHPSEFGTQVAASKVHPGVARVLSLSKDGVSALIEDCGNDIFEIAAASPAKMDAERRLHTCLAVLRDGAEILHTLHVNGIVHRDVKLENICMAQNHNRTFFRLIDFGLAERFAWNRRHLRSCGTVYIRAPELFLNKITINSDELPAADTWSLGMTIATLYLGVQMWMTASPSDAGFAEYTRHCTTHETRLEYWAAYLPLPLATAISGMLDPNPATRASLTATLNFEMHVAKLE